MKASDHFPFSDFRENQLEVINEIQREFEAGVDVIVLEGPTGFGKSPVNVALGYYFSPSYYTTPQKSLREQLGVSFGDHKGIVTLKARRDYICGHSGVNSEDCKFRQDDQYKCSVNPKCTYWLAKEELFKSQIGILTFSNLIVNSYLPLYVKGLECPKCGSNKVGFKEESYICNECENINKKNYFKESEKQISFEKRNLLIIDECQNLEGQTASLHAGFKITPNSFPKIGEDDLFQNEMWSKLRNRIPNTISEGIIFLREVLNLFNKYENSSEFFKFFIDDKSKQKINNLKNKIHFFLSELQENRKWVIDLEWLNSWSCNVPNFKPIRVDNFLQKHIWQYANKILLTSATIPYRNNIKKWLDRLGLNNKTFKFIKVPMTFPIENRPIYYKFGGHLNYKNKEKSWDNCIKNVREIINKYPNQKGVIHVSSYSMMWEVVKSLKLSNIYLHDKKKLNGEDVIEKWIESKKQILISPAINEGVDLKDDLCRFQILFKMPFANLKDKRVNHLLFKERDQEWYNNETMTKIIQSYGRAIRSKDDYADFYIIDSDFLPFYNKVVFPEWFKEAIKR